VAEKVAKVRLRENLSLGAIVAWPLGDTLDQGRARLKAALHSNPGLHTGSQEERPYEAQSL